MPPQKDEAPEGRTMAMKTCPGCDATNSIGRKTCDCGHIFKKKKKVSTYVPKGTVRGAPRKMCPECSEDLPASVAKCSACSYSFRNLKAKAPKKESTVGGAKRGRKPKAEKAEKKQKTN
eukprot:gb/GEZN01016911.1/.p1 GENE.gb/GEZN01016911.1/~~gb/GEZN01016911.1/.p1  ORF type:complete len:119 (-),score=12.23 gb/GEZN01016911.1/:378-734(-)